MDELPKLKLITCEYDKNVVKDAHMERVKRMLLDYPLEYFEPMVQALVEYIELCEEDDAVNAIYYNLNNALHWWNHYDFGESDGQEEIEEEGTEEQE